MLKMEVTLGEKADLLLLLLYLHITPPVDGTDVGECLARASLLQPLSRC